MCSISRDPRRFEYTIWTAVALLAVLTVRTYGDMPDRLEAPSRLVHNPHTKTPSQQALHAENRQK